MNRTKYKFKDILSVINGSTPSTQRPDFYDGNIIWITPKDLSNDKVKYISKSDRYITKSGYESCSTSILPIGSILLSSRAPIGLLAIAKKELCTNQGFKNLIVNQKYIDNEYLYYWLKTKIDYISSLGTGTTFKEVSKSVIEDLEIILPENTLIQQKIAKVLSDLDAKIELNNKINAELEAMAKTLYDYWFVQFDFPDANGKPYKSSGGKMVLNEELKRETPEGWEVLKMKKLANTGSGGTPLSTKKEFYENGNIPWINSGEVNEPFIVKANKFITKDGLNNSSAKLFERGTILMAMYGATAGKVSLIDIEASTNQAICGIMPFDEIYKFYIKFGLEDLYKYLISLSTGSARDNLSQDKIKELDFINPNQTILKKFDVIVSPMMNKILMNLKENQELASLRDWLLPMLMNGQVSVGDDKILQS